MKLSNLKMTIHIDIKIAFWQAIKLRIAGKHLREYIKGVLKECSDKPEKKYTGQFFNDISERSLEMIANIGTVMPGVNRKYPALQVKRGNIEVFVDSEALRLYANACEEIAVWLDAHKVDPAGNGIGD